MTTMYTLCCEKLPGILEKASARNIAFFFGFSDNDNSNWGADAWRGQDRGADAGGGQDRGAEHLPFAGDRYDFSFNMCLFAA